MIFFKCNDKSLMHNPTDYKIGQLLNSKIGKRLKIPSGARYSGVPQNVWVVRSELYKYLHKPKSATLIWPSSANNIFSNFKSR